MASNAIPQLEALMRDQMPLATAMGARITAVDDQTLTVTAPLAPNRNHHGTAFGGSLYTVALIAGWGLTWRLLTQANSPATIVIRHAEADYRRPVAEELRAVAALAADCNLAACLADLERRGSGRLDVRVAISAEGRKAFLLQARFAAVVD